MKMFKFLLKAGVVSFVAAQAAACVTIGEPSPNPDLPVTEAIGPRISPQFLPGRQALACIRKSGAIKGYIFNVYGFNDSTGKINAVSPGATGAFLPGTGTSVFITEAYKDAGAEVSSRYVATALKPVTGAYNVNGVFTALDMTTPASFDLRAGPAGPVGGYTVAMVKVTIQMDRADNGLNSNVVSVERPVRSSYLGAGVGGIAGSTLITGQATFGVQERLQHEAANGTIALAVAESLRRHFPAVNKSCGAVIANALKQTDEVPVLVAAGGE